MSLAEDRGVGEVALRVERVSKVFGETVALDDVGFSVRRQSVHALLGGNGSGKSTLVKILAGVEHGDSGSIEVYGEEHKASRTSPEWAASVGLHFVHQDIGVFGNLSVAENFAAGSTYGVGAASPIRWRTLHRRAKAVLERFEIDAPTDARMDSLGKATQTMIAVARALQQDEDQDRAGLLVLDEPTAALPAAEVEVLHDAIRGHTKRGHTVILVSHRLEEVLALCTDATFLQDGRHTATSSLHGSNEQALIRGIVGADSVKVDKRPASTRDTVRLHVEGVSVGPVEDCSFTVGQGEVVGISGLAGSGRSSLLQGIFGARRLRKGTITLDGRQLHLRNPADAVKAGIAYLPEDRAADAVFGNRSLRENLAIPALRRYWNGLVQRTRPERRDAEAAIDRYGIVIAGPDRPVSTMSGGNQQKAMLARWLELKPRLLLLDEPTQGVDIGARHAIHSYVRAAAAQGSAVVVVSTDARELSELCDRVVGLVRGRLVGEINDDEVTTARCLEIANSVTREELTALETLQEEVSKMHAAESPDEQNG